MARVARSLHSARMLESDKDDFDRAACPMNEPTDASFVASFSAKLGRGPHCCQFVLSA